MLGEIDSLDFDVNENVAKDEENKMMLYTCMVLYTCLTIQSLSC